MAEEIRLKVPRREITYLTKIIESYDNTGVVSTIDKAEGLVRILMTPDTEPLIRRILEELPFAVELEE